MEDTTAHAPKSTAPKPLYTVDEVAAFLGCHRMTIMRRIYSGDIRATKLGGRRWLIPAGMLAHELGIDPEELPA